MAIEAKAAKIELVVLDVDGVLTDGRLFYGDEGELFKAFFTVDGLGIKLAQRVGIHFAIITGRKSKIVAERARELGIESVHQGIHDKAAALDEVLARFDLQPEAACFIGDDIIDWPAMRRVGMTAAPADAVPDIRERVDYVAERKGGRGAVREVIDLLLKASGRWQQATELFL